MDLFIDKGLSAEWGRNASRGFTVTKLTKLWSKHLKYARNVHYVMSSLNEDQDMRARHKTTNYCCCMQLVGFSHASRTFSLKHRNIPEIIFWCSRFSELYYHWQLRGCREDFKGTCNISRWGIGHPGSLFSFLVLFSFCFLCMKVAKVHTHRNQGKSLPPVLIVTALQ